jgi:hypothetical protein
MKYLVLIYANPENWGHPTFLRTPQALAMSQEQRDELNRQFGELLAEVHASGELVDAQALADPVTARTARVRSGLPAVTDGPYLEAKEQLAGYFVIDCDSPQRAEEIAARFPNARFTGVELRPIMDLSGQEM